MRHSGNKDITLLLFAHPDDEFFILPAIRRMREANENVLVVYLTDGSGYGVNPLDRLQESTKVLASWGVVPSQIASVGVESGIPDLKLHTKLSEVYQQVRKIIGKRTVRRIITHAWEAGHPDHDAAHLIGFRIAKEQNVEGGLYEFSAYHTWNRRYPFVRCMKLIPAETVDEYLPHVAPRSLKEALEWAAASMRYPSQRRTFLGLLPFSLPPILLRRTLRLRLAPERNYLEPPYQGQLLSEVRFKVTFSEFVSAIFPFLLDQEEVTPFKERGCYPQLRLS